MSFLELALLGQILVWLIVCGVFFASGQASIFHPLTVYLLFHALVFIFRPIQVFLWGFDFGVTYIGFVPSEADYLRTFCVTSLALVLFAAVTILVGRSPVKFPDVLPAPLTLEQRRGLLLATLLLGPVVLYSIYRNNTGHFMGEQRNGVYVLTGDSGYVVEAQFMFGPLACAWLLATRFNWRVWVPLALYIAYRSYAGWMRWSIVLLLFAIGMMYLWQKRKRWFSVAVVLAAIPAIALFLWLGRNRDNFKVFLGLATEQRETPAWDSLPPDERRKLKNDGPDYANFDFLTFVLSMVPQRTGTYTYGSQYLQLFTEPIPRKLWPGKPVGAPVRTFSLNNYGNFIGMTPTLVGDGWMSGGWVGMLITVGVVGGLLGWAHRLFWRKVNDSRFCIFYIVGLAMLPQWYRDGGISISKFLFWNLSPLLAWVACTWVLSSKWRPVSSAVLPAGTKIRILQLPR